MLRSATLLALVGCWSSAPTVPKPSAVTVPTTRLVAISGAAAIFIKISDAGAVVERSVKLPGTEVIGLQWRGPDPIVMIKDRGVGIIGTTFTLVTLGEFPELKLDDPDASPAAAPYHLYADVDGSVWLGHCGHWGGPDGGGCLDEQFMNLANPKNVLTAINIAPNDIVLPEAPASKKIHVTLVDDPEDASKKRDDRRKLLRCTSGATTVELPEEDKREGFYGIRDLKWISTDPPVYRVIDNEAGFTSIQIPWIFEGCERSQTYADAILLVAPTNVVAVQLDDHISFYYQGREVGSVKLQRPEHVMPPIDDYVTMAFAAKP